VQSKQITPTFEIITQYAVPGGNKSEVGNSWREKLNRNVTANQHHRKALA